MQDKDRRQRAAVAEREGLREATRRQLRDMACSQTEVLGELGTQLRRRHARAPQKAAARERSRSASYTVQQPPVAGRPADRPRGQPRSLAMCGRERACARLVIHMGCDPHGLFAAWAGQPRHLSLSLSARRGRYHDLTRRAPRITCARMQAVVAGGAPLRPHPSRLRRRRRRRRRRLERLQVGGAPASEIGATLIWSERAGG
jgi:hypothetical protein